VTGINSLHDFFGQHQSFRGKYVKRDRKTGKITVLDPQPSSDGEPQAEIADKAAKDLLRSGKAQPQFTYTDGNGYPHEDLTPFDFAAIYNISPLWTAGTTGSGVTVAISGVSDITLNDIQVYRDSFKLPKMTPVIVVNGTDPGETGPGENTEDIEMVGAAAPGAQVNMVVSANTATTASYTLSDEYIIDKEYAPIMSASYGICELEMGTAGNATMNKIWQQGATEGISIFESSGDQGSAGCYSQNTAAPNYSQMGNLVNGMASSPYVTAVGGTDFTWSFGSTPISTYWNESNDADMATAKGYIPEVPWNVTCAQPLLLEYFISGGSPEFTNNEALCNAAYENEEFGDLVKITGGSGGVSSCTTPTGTTAATCAGGYAKPSWQTGTGVPADGKRDIPDVSMFASWGYPDGIVGSAILVCISSNSPAGTCDYSDPTSITYQENGGTSAASPFMAGVMAMVLQKTKSAQGLANPVFYELAAKENLSSCNSSTVKSGNSCVFYDTTEGTNKQPCLVDTRDCVVNTSGDGLGLLSGYSATTGYDQATGLGSVNVANLVNAWPTTATAPAVTLTPASLAFASTTVGATTAAQLVTVKNSGTAALTLTSETLIGTDPTSFVISAKTCGTSLAVGATCTVSVEFKPLAAGALTASLAVADNATGSPQKVALSGTATAPAVTLTPASLTFASTKVGATTAAQVVTVKNSGTAALTLTSETLIGTDPTSFVISAKTCATSLAVGATCTVSVEFKPLAAGALTASLAVADNATGSPQKVALSGTGTAATAPAVTLTPASLTFASTKVGATTAAQVVTVKNSGTAALTLTSETLTGTDPTSFVISAKTCGTSLAVGATCTVSVEFKPLAAGALTASLAVADNATGSPQKVALSGTGAATSTPTVTLTPTSIAFPATVVGVTSDAQIVTLKNTGTVAVTVSSIALGGTNASSFVEIGNCGASLAAGASCSVYVAIKPVSAAALSGALSVTDNATGSPQKVTLTGTGTAAPSVKLSVTSLAFPTTTHGTTSAAQAVTLTNGGTATLDLTAITLAGTNPTDFEELNTCGATLAPAANCVVYVAFRPAAAAAYKATLSIADSGASSPQSVALSGTGK